MNTIVTIATLLLKNFSLLRIFQMIETKKLSLKGKCLEFGAFTNNKKNFSYYTKNKNIFHLSNIDNKKNKKIIKLDLRKKLNIKSNSYDNIFIYNVLEHIENHSITFNELKRILNKNGNLFGSTPFLYQVHGAPKDYFRFTEDFFKEKFEKSGLKNIKIKCLGYGPFVACFSILQPYTKYLPLINHTILLVCYLFDFILQIFIKTKLNKIYPIGIFFTAQK